MDRQQDYLAPKAYNTRGEVLCDGDDLLSWSKSAVQTSMAYLKLQPAYPYIQAGLDMINGSTDPVGNPSLSTVQMELTIRNLKELVAAQTNIRIIPAFKTEIAEFQPQRDIVNKCFMAWQQMTFADRKLRKAWQYACGAGTGYLGERWDKSYHYKGKGDLVWEAYGPLDILPLGLPKNHDLQKAYSTCIKVETPLHEAVRTFPLYRDKISSERENTKGRGTVISQAVKFASAALRKFGPGATQQVEPKSWATVDIYYHYIDDDEVNETGQDMYMGEPGVNWAYTVPYVGKDIKIGEKAGVPLFRKALREDCLLYPNKRLIICTDDFCLNPNPMVQVSPFWHGKYPVVQFRADDWAWFFLGMPLTRAGQSLEKADNELMRGVVDSCNVRLSPPRKFDRNTMSDALASTLNTRIPNQVVGLDMTFGGSDQMTPLLPVAFYEFPAYIPQIIEQNQARLTQQMGVADAVAMSRARQLPAGDSIDKIMEALGPLVRDQSRNMEEGIRAIGEMWKSDFFQFISARRRMELIGPDGLADEDFDYDPGTLIPTSSMMETIGDKYGIQIEMEKIGTQDGVPYFQRARWHKDQFSFSVVPYSLHELNSITRKLFHLQLMRTGFPIDWWTLADLFDIKNFGEPPNFTDPESGESRPARTVMEKYVLQLEIQQRVQAALQQGTGGGGGKGGHGAGRPPTGQTPPVLEQKKTEGGTRSTIRESKR